MTAIRRMQCDQRPIIRRMRLDYGEIATFFFGVLTCIVRRNWPELPDTPKRPCAMEASRAQDYIRLGVRPFGTDKHF